jgi:heme exporter protein A
MTESMTLFASGLICMRGGRQVFSGVDFSLPAGRALAVTGPNGAGKSSLLRIIAGLLRPTGGEVGLRGGDPECRAGEEAHYLGHQDALKSSLSVRENLDFWISFLRSGGDADRALSVTGLDTLAGLPAFCLSAGQRRRLSLARLVAIKRPVWLLDEPTAALDQNAQGMLRRLMQDHLGDGGLIVAATHAPLGIAAQELALGAAA